MNMIAAAFALVAAFAQAAGPSAAQFNRAMADACPDHRPATRAIACERTDPGSVQYSCRYELRDSAGSWTERTAILQQAEGQWVWIEGETRCEADSDPALN